MTRAQHLLDTRERDYESALAELSLRMAELQSEREALTEQRLAAGREAGALARERSALEGERSSFGAKAQERLREALREFARELQRRADAAPVRPKVSASQVDLLAQTIDAMHRDLGIRPPSEESPTTAAISATTAWKWCRCGKAAKWSRTTAMPCSLRLGR